MLERAGEQRGLPKEITVDNGTESFSKAMDAWAHKRKVHLDFIRPGRPTENGYIESFNGRLRDECLNGELCSDLLELEKSWRPGGAITTNNGPTRRWATSPQPRTRSQ
jgi:transposase InsO family protein